MKEGWKRAEKRRGKEGGGDGERKGGGGEGNEWQEGY